MEDVNRFRRLIIAKPAARDGCGAVLVNWFAETGLPIIEEYDDKAVLHHPDIDRPGTLVVAGRPPMGWVTSAEHGLLAMRRGERYLNPIAGCRSSCTYCYLRAVPQGLLPLRFYVDIGDLLEAIDADLAGGPGDEEKLFCTGELADSLADIELYPVATTLIDHFSRRANCRLELRTKSDAVGRLLPIDHHGRTTVAFSITPREVGKSHEPGTSPLSARLDAAARCQKAGYPVALKFEPIILVDGWERLYIETLDLIASRVGFGAIEHVSVGCLRWSEGLARVSTFEKQYGPAIQSGEWIEYRPGKRNGTLRRNERLGVYEWMRHQLRQRGLEAPIWWSLEEPDLIMEMERRDHG